MQPLYIWIAIAVGTVVIEALTVDLVSIWFTCGALSAIVVSLLHGNLTYQIAAFVIVTVLAAIITRPIAKKMLRGNVVHTNADRYIHKKAIVTTTIEPDHFGEVKVNGSYWSAVSLDGSTILKDRHVEILAIEGVKMIVREITE